MTDDPTPPPPPQQHPSFSLPELRVLQQELYAGNQSGQVFLRLSPGSVAFPIDRPVARARVERHIQKLVEEEEKELDTVTRR
jgi:hypothetical protein